ncbi:GFA family protein [Albidovulum sp.]|uniref:GFA family protein n=1 Tax=Albidovulum sp. TaxID=1872424 RepID=UPI001DA634FC|nr:GFA family protein [Paracoccaceae bacterium]HRV61402.1 GFA family protein [Albidovulum sp.]MCB2138521.1 GFA family protein [Paracoccaceae bacterium]MCB2150763.1 GFA family protein [Paracoccaceae bacterium]MCP5353769.1 GFA family protein [Paracoccaceae bacterium]
MTYVKGSCLCRSVQYEAAVSNEQVLACHCEKCARTSGHHAVMVACSSEGPDISDRNHRLRWYRSSFQVDRGFCSECGGNVFWRDLASGTTYVTLGTVDGPTGLSVTRHIFVGSKSDYYDITDGLPQAPEW